MLLLLFPFEMSHHLLHILPPPVCFPLGLVGCQLLLSPTATHSKSGVVVVGPCVRWVLILVGLDQCLLE